MTASRPWPGSARNRQQIPAELTQVITTLIAYASGTESGGQQRLSRASLVAGDPGAAGSAWLRVSRSVPPASSKDRRAMPTSVRPPTARYVPLLHVDGMQPIVAGMRRSSDLAD